MKLSIKKKILLTGASGFIGNVLVNEFIKNGINPRCVTRKQYLSIPKNDSVIINNINRNTKWDKALKKIDIVIHLAARAHVIDDNTANPLKEFRKTNVDGTLNLAKQALESGIKRFIFLSSIKVNGEGYQNKKYFENDIPSPSDAYGISKYEAEEKLKKLFKGTKTDLVIIRPPLVYGPGVKANFLKMIKIVDKRIPLPLANIQNSRSLIYVKNLVDAIYTCAIHLKAANQTFLVSDGHDISTPDLIKQIAQSLNKPNPLFPFPVFLLKALGRVAGEKRVIDRLTNSLTVDISKIKNLLNWSPPYTLEHSLQETISWYNFLN